MTLHIETVGRGEDVVLLHGWGLHGAVWRRVADALAADYCVHMVDLPGCGGSPMQQPYTLAAITESLAAAFPLPIHVLGWSMGGAIALHWALSQPDRIRTVSLCASSPCFVQKPDWPQATPAATLAAFAAELAQDPVATVNQFLGLQVMGSRDGRSVLRALQASLAERPLPSPEALQAGLDLLRTVDLRAAVPGLVVPLLLQSGDRDRMTPPAAAQWLAQASGASHVQHPGAGHAPFISHEADFLRAQRAFLARY